MARELSEIYEVNVDKDYTMGQVLGVVGLGGVLVYSILFFSFVPPEVIEQQAVVAATSTEQVVEERDGGLWYPDGVPIRNYEQLEIYNGTN